MARKLKPLLWRTTQRDAERFILGVEHIPGDWDKLMPKSLLKIIDGVDALICECAMLGEVTPSEGLALKVGCKLARDLVREMKQVKEKTGGANHLSAILDMWLVERVRGSGRLVYQLETLAEQQPAIAALMSHVLQAYGEPPRPPARADRIDDVIDAEFVERGALTPAGAKALKAIKRRRSSRPAKGMLEQLNNLGRLRRAYLERDMPMFAMQTGIVWPPASAMMANRNIRMARRLLELLKETPKTRYLIGIGIGHLLGPASVLDLMAIGGVPTEKVGW